MYYIKKIKRFFKDKISVLRLRKYYNSTDKLPGNQEQWVIYMCDGRRLHGGLGDRLSGLVSTYAYCKDSNKVFKCNFTFPYKLEEFLVPNKYDWRIEENELSYNASSSRPFYISYRNTVRAEQELARKMLNRKEKQLHVYSNMKYFHPTNFRFLFDELFKPSDSLQKAIDEQSSHLPQNYVSITFRFQQLLGDLEEGNFPTLKTQAEREQLIEQSLKFVETVHRMHPELDKFLVTSDSISFLHRAGNLPYVYTIPGEIVHVDFNTKKVDLSVHLKSFVDLFMIAKANKIYSVVYPPLYRTGFPLLASMLFGNEYIELDQRSI